jgi:hypothetical protein
LWQFANHPKNLIGRLKSEPLFLLSVGLNQSADIARKTPIFFGARFSANARTLGPL